MDLLAQVRRFIARQGLLDAGDAVVVGVSGGPDSLCLLHLLMRLRETLDLRLHVAHLHHGARGADADADADFVADLARRYDLPVTIGRQDVPAIARQHRLAFEEAARRVRYAFLAHVAAETDASRIAVGHHADDQAETVLMHLLRGAGPSGLRGMLPATPLDAYRLLEGLGGFHLPADPPILIRPLLDVRRAAIEEYCQNWGLEPRFDRSNLDTTHFRNRLRHQVLPLLETVNPNICQRLCHTAQVIAADYELLEALGEQAWATTVSEETAEAIRFDRAAWQRLPLSLQRSLIRQAAYRLRPHLRDVSFVHVENAVQVAQEGVVGAQATLPDGLLLTAERAHLTIAGAGWAPPPSTPCLPAGSAVDIALPGATPLPQSDWVLHAGLLEQWNLADIAANADPWTAYLDAEALAAPLRLRTRQQGDRFRPQGLGGHGPRLSDWMINARVPRAQREGLPLLVAGEEIVWVCGWRIAETAAVGPETQRVARFRFSREER